MIIRYKAENDMACMEFELEHYKNKCQYLDQELTHKKDEVQDLRNKLKRISGAYMDIAAEESPMGHFFHRPFTQGPIM